VNALLWGASIALVALAFACLWRVDAGPSVQDRILAVNVVGVKTMVVLALLAAIRGPSYLLDVAVVYGLLNFVITIAATRLIETGRLGGDAP
jgi:multicomponent Na+:H+ antiporter subunit F